MSGPTEKKKKKEKRKKGKKERDKKIQNTMNGGTKQIQPERGEGQHVFKSHHAKRCETKPRLLKGKLLLKSKWQVYEHAQERGNHFQRCEYHVWEKFEAMETPIRVVFNDLLPLMKWRVSVTILFPEYCYLVFGKCFLFENHDMIGCKLLFCGYYQRSTFIVLENVS